MISGRRPHGDGVSPSTGSRIFPAPQRGSGCSKVVSSPHAVALSWSAACRPVMPGCADIISATVAAVAGAEAEVP